MSAYCSEVRFLRWPLVTKKGNSMRTYRNTLRALVLATVAGAAMTVVMTDTTDDRNGEHFEFVQVDR